MKKLFSCAFLFLLTLSFNEGYGQLSETFSDSDYTNNPAWVGNTASWMIDSAKELRSNDTVASHSFYLSTANSLATETQWDIYIQLAFNPSALNYVDVYLIASDSVLTNATTSGYFVRLGGSGDEILLYRKGITAGDTTRIIDGVNGVLNTSSNKIKLRVIRDASNKWSVYRDLSGTGANFFLEGTATDAAYTTSSYFGILVKQSTSSFFRKHYFDDIEIKSYVPDVTPPSIQSVTVVTGTALDVLFNEPVDVATAQNVTNYNVDNGIGNPVTATRDAGNAALVHLTFAARFPNAGTNTLTVSNIADVAGNVMTSGTATFSYVGGDFTPPAISTVTVLSANTLDLLFTEPVEATSAQTLTNFTVNNGVGNPSSATLDATNKTLVHLLFAATFASGVTNTITASNINDTIGNTLNNGTASFVYTAPYIAQKYDIIITELMPDPDPPVQLPNAEYVELKNISGKSIDLAGWKLTSSSTVSSSFRSTILQPDSFLIVTTTTNAPLFSPYGTTLGLTGFPSLLNSGTTLSLISPQGATIHSISYTIDWYQNELKSGGGWSLEMIDTQSPCIGAGNWRASVDAKGGTPGTVNSVNSNNPDQTGPSVTRVSILDSVTLLINFDEGVDSLKASIAGNYSIAGGSIQIVFASPASPDFTMVRLSLNGPLQYSTIYTVTVSNVSDCSGNVISTGNSYVFGLPQTIDSFDLVINEVLFDPKPNEVDYVEIYNRSSKILDLKNLYIATRSLSGALINNKQFSTVSRFIFPGDYFVITTDATIVKQRYTALNPANFVEVSTLPTFANENGVVVLANINNRVIDELAYDVKWHFALLDNKEGVSLERIDPDKPTQDQNNWHSAASTAGYGTPTYKNSQYKADVSSSGEISAVPKIFSPDNDGYEDYTTINYQLSDNGYVANITIFDAAGRPVKVLARNATLGLKGSFRWDGLDDKQKRVSVGAYIVYTEIFNLAGKKRSFKTPVIVASRF